MPPSPEEEDEQEALPDLTRGPRERGIAELYATSWRALRLARGYALEPGTSGRRERECVAEVRRLRRVIAARRASPEASADGPGLRKAEAEGAAPGQPRSPATRAG